MWFNTDHLVQNYVSVIYNEGRLDELIKICDFHHGKLPNIEDVMEVVFNFGEYVGKFYFGTKLWRFYYPDGEGSIYFLGSIDEIKKKVREIL
jgi:hypothetical protein